MGREKGGGRMGMKVYIADLDLFDEKELYHWLKRKYPEIFMEWIKLKESELELMIAERKVSKKLRELK